MIQFKNIHLNLNAIFKKKVFEFLYIDHTRDKI